VLAENVNLAAELFRSLVLAFTQDPRAESP
jgi:hypothetical protein